MAKLTDVTNPLTKGTANILSPGDWLGSILWVAWIGAVFTIGAKFLSKADAIIPGNVTPTGYNMISTPQIAATNNEPLIY